MENVRSAQNGKIPIRGVIFDYGKVLCLPQPASDVEALAAIAGVPAPRFRELYWKHRVPYDRSDLSAETYWQAVAHEENKVFSPEQIRQLVSLDTESWAHPNLQTVNWAEQLHNAGLRLGLLSNMPSDLARYLTVQCDWLRFFDHLTFSCDVRLVKPDAAIYRACLEPLHLAPQEVLFLDDLKHNVEGATKVGIHGQLFDTLEETSARLEQRFDLPLPGFPEGRNRVSMAR